MSSILGTGFLYHCTARLPCGRVIDFEQPNRLPQAAINHNAALLRGIGQPIGPWFVGLFEGDYTPTKGVLASDLPTSVGEFVGYNEALRPQWNDEWDDESVMDNSADRAIFTFNTGRIIHGAFICSSSAKGSGSGLLLSIARFDTPRDLPAGTEFAVTAGLTLVPTI